MKSLIGLIWFVGITALCWVLWLLAWAATS